jgi:hypothetical protein
MSIALLVGAFPLVALALPFAAVIIAMLFVTLLGV